MRIVIKKHKSIYIPITKVACSSIKDVCARLIGIRHKDKNIHKIPFPGHVNPGVNYFTFVFVRNPWDRLVSCFLNKMKQNSRKKDDPTDVFINGIWYGFEGYAKRFKWTRDTTFTQFAEGVCQIKDPGSEDHIRSQLSNFNPKNPKLFIGRFENLKEDWDQVKKQSGIPLNLPHIMQTVNRKKYREYYTDELAEKVAKRYENDVKLLGYDF